MRPLPRLHAITDRDVLALDDFGSRVQALATAGPERYAVAVGLFTDKLEDTLFQLSLLLGAVWLGSLALTAVLGFTLASRALEPVRAITRQAATIAQGQFDPATGQFAPGFPQQPGVGGDAGGGPAGQLGGPGQTGSA